MARSKRALLLAALLTPVLCTAAEPNSANRLGSPVPIPEDPTAPIPDIGDRTSDRFQVKCYWVGTFQGFKKAEGQGVIDLFGQLLSPLCYKQKTTASVIITEEIGASGAIRAVLRSGRWKSDFSNLHYWLRSGKRLVARGNASTGERSFPLAGPDAPSVAISHDLSRKGTVAISFGVPLRTFEVEHRGLKSGGHRGLEIMLGENTKSSLDVPIMNMNAEEEEGLPDTPTELRCESGSPSGNFYQRWTMTRVCSLGKLKLITPRGDPRTEPRDSGDGQNEFTFDGTSSGKLVINFKASVTPASAINSVRDRVSFSIDPISGSTLDWHHDNPNGKAKVENGFLVATATFTGLPAKNDDFGLKTVQLLLDGKLCAKTKVEIFFARDATNHPGGQANSPNWFHYWSQLRPGDKLKYGGTSNAQNAEVEATRRWTYNGPVDKKEITIYDGTKGKYRSYGVGEEFSGIDRFLGTVKHEARHVTQIANADKLVRSNGSDAFRFGWAWKTPHNHWAMGADQKWGVAGSDDDGNGTTDDAKLGPPFEPGQGDDENLSHPNWWYWPKSWPIPAPNRAPSPLESDAVNYSDTNHNEHQNARDDWADPGKNHKTLNRYDD